MFETEICMSKFQAYVKIQVNENKPLYQWMEYDHYDIMDATISELDETVGSLEPVYLPRKHIGVYLKQATQLSLAVSKAAVFAMKVSRIAFETHKSVLADTLSTTQVMSQKSSTCFAEIEASRLSSQDKDEAKIFVTNELEKLVHYCTRATSSVYTALDLLRESLLLEEDDEAADNESSLPTQRKGWFWKVAAIVLGASASVALGFHAADLCRMTNFDIARNCNNMEHDLFGELADLFQRTQSVMNLSSEVYSVKMQHVDQHYKALEAITEAQGMRIDNLVESLGPTNDEGLYFSKTSKANVDAPENNQHREDKVSESMKIEVQRLRLEMEKVRRNMNLVDLRLTRRLDKVERGR